MFSVFSISFSLFSLTGQVYAALGCASCHQCPPYGPDYANVGPLWNSHISHTSAPFSYTCDICHIQVTTGAATSDAYTITFATNHVNGSYNLNPKSGYSFTYNTDYSLGRSTCSNISCHGNKSAVWGSQVSCWDCHVSTTDLDDYVFNNQKTASISTHSVQGWFGPGHGLDSGSYYSGNVAANFGGSDGCKYCHNSEYAHGYSTGTNFFRLANSTTVVYGAWTNTFGYNGNCMVCHDKNTTPPGYLGKTATKFVKTAHYGAKHGQEGTNTTDGGRFCWDCHDPHGDYSVAASTPFAYMFQIAVVELTRGVTSVASVVAGTTGAVFGVPYYETYLATWTVTRFDFSTGTNKTDWDYNDYTSSHTFRFICQSCHSGTGNEAADTGGGPTVKYHTRSTWTAEAKHQQGACPTCHSRDDNFKGAGKCETCHAVDTADNNNYLSDDGNKAVINKTEWAVTGHGRSSTTYYDSKNRGAGIGDSRITGDGSYCLYCHRSDLTHPPNPSGNFFLL